MTNSIQPGWLSRAYRIRWKPVKLPLPQNLSSCTDVFLSAPLSLATQRHEDRAIWFMDFCVYVLLDPGFHRWIRIRRINSATGNSATSFLDNISECFSPTTTRISHLQLNIHYCSKINNSIFAMSTTTYIPLRHLTVVILSELDNYFFLPTRLAV